MESASTSLIVLKELAGNPPVGLNPLQQLVAPHIDILASFWTSVWIMTAVVLCIVVIHEYRNRNR